ncbi:MAG: hypothetical protein ABI273_22525, partial [Lacunisphaera sp.]
TVANSWSTGDLARGSSDRNEVAAAPVVQPGPGTTLKIQGAIRWHGVDKVISRPANSPIR